MYDAKMDDGEMDEGKIGTCNRLVPSLARSQHDLLAGSVQQWNLAARKSPKSLPSRRRQRRLMGHSIADAGTRQGLFRQQRCDGDRPITSKEDLAARATPLLPPWNRTGRRSWTGTI